MGLKKSELPAPGNLLNDLFDSRQIRFAGDECFLSEKAVSKIPSKPPTNPKPRDLYIGVGRKKDPDGMRGKFAGKDVMVKYYVRTTGAPLEAQRENGEVVSVDRIKEYEVAPQEYRLHLVEKP